MTTYFRPMIALGLAVATFIFGAPDVAANVLNDDRAHTYRKARRLVEDKPADAYELAASLGPFAYADDRRMSLLADAAIGAGKVDAAICALAEMAAHATRPIDRLFAHIERAELLLLQGDLCATDSALRAADRAAAAADQGSNDRRRLRARKLRVEHDLAAARGQPNDLRRAKHTARTLLTQFPTQPASRMPGLLVAPGDLNGRRRYQRAVNLYDHWAYREARQIFTHLRSRQGYRGRARWYLAHIALNKLRDRPKAAQKLFETLAREGPHRQESLYQLARAQMRREHYGAALDTLETYRQRYPHGHHTESVYYYRGWLPYDHRHNKQAVGGFKQYIRRYGKSAGRSSYIYGFLAWTYMRMHKWQQAIDTYEEMRPFGNMLVWGKALYWQAYAFDKLDRPKRARAKLDELRSRYAVTYYGVLGEQLRARIDGDDPHAANVWWPDGGGALDDTPHKTVDDFQLTGLSDAVRNGWRRVRALVELGERHRARKILDDIDDDLLQAAPAGQRNAWIHTVGHFVQNYHHMWVVSTGGSIAAMAAPPNPTSLKAAMAYPRTYRDVVDRVADEFDLPAELMWSLMRQESRYRPAQISYTDAVGALQMIPKTARKVADRLGTTYNPRTFSRPKVGFRYSGYYLRKLLDAFSGLIVPAAAAYNSGPQIVAHWFAQNPAASFPWLIEEFAYNEGRNYARKVAEHMVRYLYLYEDDLDRRGRILNRLFPVSRDIDLAEDIGF